MPQRLLIGLILVLAAAVIGLAFFWQPARMGAGSTAGPAGGDFTLRSAAGPVSLRDFRGKVVLLFFGYTYCPDVCPTALTAAGQAFASLSPEETDRVRAVFVSVDPERDTVAQLKNFTAFFHPNIVGVTGTPEQVAAAARLYGAFYARQPASGSAGYVIDHTASTYVIAPDGRLAATLPHGTPPAAIVTEIRRQLSSKGD